jgi:hypothetical protein
VLSARAVSVLERGERKHPYTVRFLAKALNLSEDERAPLLASVPRRNTATALATGSQPNLLSVSPILLVGRERELGEIRGFLGCNSLPSVMQEAIA